MGIDKQLFAELQLAPSILSADFARLEEQVEDVLRVGARVIHVDVMDGHFVPNITIGPLVVRSLAPVAHRAGAVLDVHLMIEEPDRYLQDFVSAGADGLSVHVEACPHLHRTLSEIRRLGAAAGIAINPATDLSLIGEAVHFADYVLLMSVNPGFGGQQFITRSLDRLVQLSRSLPPGVGLEIDGGVGRETIEAVAGAGARWLVSGSAVFGAPDPGAEFTYLRDLALRGSDAFCRRLQA